MSTSYQDSYLKKFLDAFTVAILIVGAIIGYKAFIQYEKLNNISIETSLLNYDREMNSKLVEKRHLQSLFAHPPKLGNALKEANFLVNICMNNLRLKNNIDWKDVPDLYNKLWGHEGFHDEGKYYVRDVFNYCENVITILLNAYWFFKEGYITNESWETWLGYIKELGTHPIFLCALHGCVKYGYIDKDFAEDIKKEILKMPDNQEIINIIYGEMLKPDWQARVSKP